MKKGKQGVFGNLVVDENELSNTFDIEKPECLPDNINDELAIDDSDIGDNYGNKDANYLPVVDIGGDVLQKYIRHISQFPLLTQEEEERLFAEYLDNGNQEAGQKIILSHLRLVVKIAMKYRRYGVNLMDIISEGNTGLMRALQKFDRSKNTRFSTYAILWIRAYIQDFILKSWSLVKIGSTTLRKQLLFNLRGIKKMLHLESGNTVDEQKKLAKHFGVSRVEMVEAQNALQQRDVALDVPAGDNTKATILDTISKDDGDFENELADTEEKDYRMKIFRESLSILDERQREIIISRYLSENKKTLDELSHKFGISKERVRQIEEAGIKKLKKFAENYDK